MKFLLLTNISLTFLNKKYEINKIKLISFILSLIIFLFSLYIFLIFDNSILTFQLTNYYNYTWYYKLYYSNIILSIDGISLLFLILTTYLFPCCILIS